MNGQYLSSCRSPSRCRTLSPPAGALARAIDRGRLHAAVDLHRIARAPCTSSPRGAPLLHRGARLRSGGGRQVPRRPRPSPTCWTARVALGRGRAVEQGALEERCAALATERGVKAGALIHPTRMALSATTAGPPLFDLVEVLGRRERGAAPGPLPRESRGAGAGAGGVSRAAPSGTRR